MPSFLPGNHFSSIRLTPSLALRSGAGWAGFAELAAPGVAAQRGPAEAPFDPDRLTLFSPAEPAIELRIHSAAQPRATGELEYQPADPAVYVLLQMIDTAGGTVYDVTLPAPPIVRSKQAARSGGSPPVLRFPVNLLMPAAPEGGASPRGLASAAELPEGDRVTRRVLQILRSPIDRTLRSALAQAEPAPQVLALRNTFGPLDGFEDWRALLPPGGERRVLLFLHGFGSSTMLCQAGAFLPQLAAGYDAVLSYDHPTISRDPLENARALLERIPDDLRLSVDLVAHSRGGLVARSLIELLGAPPQLAPRRLVTHGTPHSGTRMADPECWDRLISLGMTATSWLAGSGAALFMPRLLEYLLKAAAQSIFDLPGIAAMRPEGRFLARLNGEGAASPAQRIGEARYAVTASTFDVHAVHQAGLRAALSAAIAHTFLAAPNDLIVPTDSTSAANLPGLRVPEERQCHTAVDHFSYFSDARATRFLREQLAADG